MSTRSIYRHQARHIFIQRSRPLCKHAIPGRRCQNQESVCPRHRRCRHHDRIATGFVSEKTWSMVELRDTFAYEYLLRAENSNTIIKSLRLSLFCVRCLFAKFGCFMCYELHAWVCSYLLVAGGEWNEQLLSFILNNWSRLRFLLHKSGVYWTSLFRVLYSIGRSSWMAFV